MRISDWSSDVCSSDLQDAEQRPQNAHHRGFRPASRLFGHVCRDLHRYDRVGVLHRLATLDLVDVFHAFDYMTPDGVLAVEETGIGDRKSVVSGTGVSVSVDLGGRRCIKKKKNE